jgi:hypothetical protein
MKINERMTAAGMMGSIKLLVLVLGLALLLSNSHAFSPSSTFMLATPFSNARSSLLHMASRDVDLTVLKASTRDGNYRNSNGEEEEFDVVVIGAGVGGLSCAALGSSRYGWWCRTFL